MTLRTIGCLVIFTFGLCCMPCGSRAACGKGAPHRLSERGYGLYLAIEVFRQQLHDLGYKNGQSVVIEGTLGRGSGRALAGAGR